MNKSSKYDELMQHISVLIEGEDDIISIMSTIACEIYRAFDSFHWVGFYRLVDERTLKVGPYQGGHGCLTIDIDRGVCGRCVREKQIQIENDVNAVPHHIACSPESKSEIVLPVCDRAGELRAVLDIDSTERDSFDQIDADNLSAICALLYR